MKTEKTLPVLAEGYVRVFMDQVGNYQDFLIEEIKAIKNDPYYTLLQAHVRQQFEDAISGKKNDSGS